MATDDRDMLTDEGRVEVESLARRYDVSPDAVLVLLRALERGGGEQAQFTHPDLGGMGQWSRRGMIMVGDMFNDALKARVDTLCRETAALLDRPGLLRKARRRGKAGAWWPEGCGTPSASGAQNDRRYAFFPDTRRLAIGHGERVELYDTGDHRIHGVSQQQGAGSDLRFTSQLGIVALHELRRVDDAASPRVSPDFEHKEPAQPRPRSGGADILDTLERLHELQRKGVLSEAELAAKKRDLLDRL